MKKVLLLMAALLTLGGGAVSAKKVYADLSSGNAIGNATWTSGTNTFAWTKDSYAYMVVPGGSFAGDLSEYTTVGLTVASIENEFRVDILANGKTFTGKGINTNGKIVLNILQDFNLQWNPDLITKEDLKSVTAVRLNTNSASGSAVITDFYIAKPAALSFDDEGNAEFDLTDLFATGGLSFDEKTGLLTNDGTGGRLYINMPKEGIDFSSFLSMTVDRSGDDIINNSLIEDTKNGISNGFWGSKYGVNFTVGDAMKFNNATNVNTIYWDGNTTAGTMTISSIKVKANVITCSVPGTPVSLNTLQYHNFPSGSNATATWNVNTATDTYYGSGSSDPSNYVDLTGYEVLRIHRDDATGFRAFFINAAGTGTNNINDQAAGTVSWVDAGKYWEIDLSKVEKYQDKVYLNTIKSSAWGVKNVVKDITLYKTPEGAANYLLSGKGALTPSAAAALNDANAKIYDATGITGTGVELTPANPNAIFVANAGALDNDKNVCVDGNIANLVITDGKPFAFPEGTTASNASYSRKFVNEWGTVCLPFEMTAVPDVIQFYTITGIDEDELVLEEMATVPAGVPVLAYVPEKSFDVTAKDAALKDVQVSNSTYPLIGTYEYKEVSVTDDVNYYAISNNQFVQAVADPTATTPTAATISLGAFRAYFTAPTSNGANLRFPAGEATAIKALAGAGEVSVVGIYSANGVQQRSLQKGINVVKLSNGATQKILVK